MFQTGTWSYTIERFTGNPQPHFVQVLASPRTPTAPVVRARLWSNQITDQGKSRYRRSAGDEEIAEVTESAAVGTAAAAARTNRELIDTSSTVQDVVTTNSLGEQQVNLTKPVFRFTVEDLRKSKVIQIFYRFFPI